MKLYHEATRKWKKREDRDDYAPAIAAVTGAENAEDWREHEQDAKSVILAEGVN